MVPLELIGAMYSPNVRGGSDLIGNFSQISSYFNYDTSHKLKRVKIH